MKFQGFTQKTLDFLKDIGENNNREWFEEHKNVYRKEVYEPLAALASDLSSAFIALDSEIDPSPRGAVSRINRDVRFSKDKSPYRNRMWLTVKRRTADWKMFPCFYFEIEQNRYSYGVGFYSATTAAMAAMRAYIKDKPDEFRKLTAFSRVKDGFSSEGETYKRILDKTIPEDLIPWFQKKNIYVVKTCPADGLLFKKELAEKLMEELETLTDFYHFCIRIAYSESGN